MNEAMKIALKDMESDGFNVELFDNGKSSEENIKTTKATTKRVKKLYPNNGKRGRKSF